MQNVYGDMISGNCNIKTSKKDEKIDTDLVNSQFECYATISNIKNYECNSQ